jgi:hypothetical protein
MFRSNAPRRALFLGAAAALTTLFSFGSAEAASFSITNEGGGNATTHTLTSNFNPAGWTNPDGVGVGTTIATFTSDNDGCTPSCNIPTGLFVNPGNLSLTFTYLGHEATDVDRALIFNNTLLFTNTSTPNGTSTTVAFNLGSGNALIPFKFTDTNDTDKSAPNGGPIDSGVSLGIYVTSDKQTAFLFFDDKNGGHQDGDYDDMIVEVTLASTTPLPGALPLFASGLGVIGALGWRRKQKKVATAA